MKYVELGKSGIQVSVMSLGCWALGGGGYWAEKTDDEASLRTIAAAMDAGINFYDTAEVYGAGHSDELLGRAMEGNRDAFIVATKVYVDRHKTKNLEQSCNDSLKRLKTDYIDLFYPHFAPAEKIFEETIEALFKLKKQGKVREIGICNFGLTSLKHLAEMGNMKEVVMHQLPYNLLWRAIEYGIQQETVKNSIGIVAYSSLAQGLLTGIYESVDQVPDNLKVARLYHHKHVNADHGEEGCEEDMFGDIKVIKELCRQNGLDMAAASIAWLFMQEGIASVLTGPTNTDQLKENLKALDVSLTPELASKMSQITENVKEKMGDRADMWFPKDRTRII